MTFHDFIVALLGAVVTIALQAAAASLIAFWQYSHQEFSGTIYGVLPTGDGKGERIDKMRVRQIRQRIQVKARRISPPEEAGRRWKGTGKALGTHTAT
jgi:hypothetical protein